MTRVPAGGRACPAVGVVLGDGLCVGGCAGRVAYGCVWDGTERKPRLGRVLGDLSGSTRRLESFASSHR